MKTMTTDINWDGKKIKIRPSTIDSFYGCAFQWANVFLAGKFSIPSARASIGTAVHKGVEVMWIDAMLSKSKEDINLTMMKDAAIEKYQADDTEHELMYERGEDSNMAEDLVVTGVEVFVEDIVPYVSIPKKVEHYLTMPIDNPVVDEIGGTIDYIDTNEIADVKTSKRKPIPQSYVSQQDVYKLLAEKHGYKINRQVIHGIAFTQKPVGHILEVESKMKRTKYLVNHMLDTLTAFEKGSDPKLLFRGNPKYYLCDERYCNFYNKGCPYVNGDES